MLIVCELRGDFNLVGNLKQISKRKMGELVLSVFLFLFLPLLEGESKQGIFCIV